MPDQTRGKNMKEFDGRVERCTPATRSLLAFLRTVAEHAGDDVESPTFDGVEGTGITYRRAGKRFCRFDPKHQADHIWALIPGADRIALASAGTVSDRADGPWVTITNMRGAVRIVQEILRAHDAVEPSRQ
jgi:hypothetical protein